MASKTTYTCDRCGNSIKEGKSILKFRDKDGMEIRLKLPGNIGEYSYDLCSDCTHNLMSWIEQGGSYGEF